MLASGIDRDARHDLLAITVDQFQPALARRLREQFGVARVDRTILYGSGGVGVMFELLALDPDARLGKEIDAVEVIPVDVRDDDVAHVFRLHTGALHGFARWNEIRRMPPIQKI